MPHTGVKHSTLPAAERRRLREQGDVGGLQNAVRIAQMFAELSRAAAEAANARALAAAEANIQVGRAQLALEETDERRRIAQTLARHSGTLRVNAAYRGTAGSRSAEGLQIQAAGISAQSAAVVSANTAFRVQQLINQNIVDLEDPNLAALEGGLRGFAIGQQIQGALDSLATKTVVPLRGHIGTGLRGDPAGGVRGGQTIFTTPGFDLGALFAAGGEFNFDELLNL